MKKRIIAGLAALTLLYGCSDDKPEPAIPEDAGNEYVAPRPELPEPQRAAQEPSD